MYSMILQKEMSSYVLKKIVVCEWWDESCIFVVFFSKFEMSSS